MDDGTIECPLHGARFDVRTGRVCLGPAVDDIQRYAVGVEHDTVLVDRRHEQERFPAPGARAMAALSRLGGDLAEAARRARCGSRRLRDRVRESAPRAYALSVAATATMRPASAWRGFWACRTPPVGFHARNDRVAQSGCRDRGYTSWRRDRRHAARKHHANFVPWQQLALKTGATFKIAEITEDGGWISITSASRSRLAPRFWRSLMSRTPLARLRRLPRSWGSQKGAIIVVAYRAQSAPHVEFDRLGVDSTLSAGTRCSGLPALAGSLGGGNDWDPCRRIRPAAT